MTSLAPDFRAQASAPLPCRTRPALFHTPDNGESREEKTRRVEQARDLCLDCPLMISCRDWARTTRARGVIGGESEEERAAAGYRPVDRETGGEVRPECGTEAGGRWHRRHGEVVDAACLRAENAANRSRRHVREAAYMTQWPPRLTPTEQAVLRSLADGRDRTDIAARHGISRKQVAKYAYQLRMKLRVRQDAQLVPAAREAGVLPEAPGGYAKAA